MIEAQNIHKYSTWVPWTNLKTRNNKSYFKLHKAYDHYSTCTVLNFDSQVTYRLLSKNWAWFIWIHHVIKVVDFLPKSKNINAKKCTNWRFGHKIERNFGNFAKIVKDIKTLASFYGQTP